MRPRDWNIRLRLTLLHGGLVLLSGALLLCGLYVLVDRGISRQSIEVPVISPGEPVATGAAGASDERAAVLLKQRTSQAERDLRESFRRQTLPPLFNRGLVALGLLAAGGLWVGWVAAGRTLRPIQQITATARRVAGRSLHERIGLDGPNDELRELADTFDGMLGRLHAAFEGQRQFVGNASHELRTPLAINRTLIEVAIGRADAPPQLRLLGETLLEVSARQERLIDGLLILARSEHEIVDPAPVDLAELAAGVVEGARHEADRLGLEMTLSASPAPLEGDPVLLERLVQNLVQNALRHNTAKGWVRVSAARDGATVRLKVANTGRRVPPTSVPSLFEPFRRATDRVGSAGGTGIGLSIVRSVARAHGGTVTAAAREGGGLLVEVALPGEPRGPVSRVAR